MGWASGFQAGSAMAKQWLDTYRQADIKRRSEAVRKGQPMGGFTQEEADKIEGLSKQVDERGRPLYKIVMAPDSTWQVPQYEAQKVSYPTEAPAQVRGLSAEEEQYLSNVERAVNPAGLPYYSVKRGDDGTATVRARSIYDDGGFVPYSGYEDELRRLEKAYPKGSYSDELRPTIEAEKAAVAQARDELIKQYESTAKFGGRGLTSEAKPKSYVDDRGNRILSPDEIAMVRSNPNYDPRIPENEQFNRLFGAYGGTPISGEEIRIAPASVDFLGKQYGLGENFAGTPDYGLSPEKQKQLRMEAYADILSDYDPMEGLKFKLAVDKDRREAMEMGLKQQQEARAQKTFNLNEQITKFQISQLKRGEKQDIAEDKFLEDVKKDPSILQGDLLNTFSTYGISPDRGNKLIEGVLGLEKNVISRMQTEVDKAMIKSQGNLDKFLQLSLDDKKYDPTSHLVKRQGPNGGIIIDTVETLEGNKAGKVISSTPELPNAVEAMEFIYNTLRNPGTAAQTALKNQQLRADIEEKRATAKYKLSAADFYSRRGTGAGAGAGGLGRGGKFQFAGEDSDGTPIVFDSRTGKLSRGDGQPIQDPTFVKKFTGEQTKSIKEQWSEINKELLKSGQPPNYIARAKASFYAENGYAPDEAISVLRSGKNPDTGKPLTQADIDAFRQTYPNTDISKFMPKPDGQKGLGKTDTVTNELAEPKAPVEDKKKYIRSKNPRGGWVYEESPRGLTKAQYAEIDAKR